MGFTRDGQPAKPRRGQHLKCKWKDEKIGERLESLGCHKTPDGWFHGVFVPGGPTTDIEVKDANGKVTAVQKGIIIPPHVAMQTKNGFELTYLADTDTGSPKQKTVAFAVDDIDECVGLTDPSHLSEHYHKRTWDGKEGRPEKCPHATLAP